MMYAVFFSGGSCSDAYETLLFVTHDEQVAASFCSTAMQQYQQALNIPGPYSSSQEFREAREKGTKAFERYTLKLKNDREQYKNKLLDVMKIDPNRACEFGLDKSILYYYEEVEVR